MFTCCHPGLPFESQIALTLKILCGFSSAEIARAFLTQEAAIQKRLYRARQKIKDDHLGFEVPALAELPARRQAVLSVLYLMFNEGYSASFAEQPIRRDVCLEAMRLCKLLTEHECGRDPSTFALMALMCLHAARFDARLDSDGNLLTMKYQDRKRWSQPLIAEGFHYMDLSASGDELTEMHLEAGIAGTHCLADSYEHTDWDAIINLYDRLTTLKSSPILALNRAIALAERRGPRAGLEAIQNIPDQVLEGYYLFWATLGEMHLRLGEFGRAAPHFERAIALTSSRVEQQFLHRKLETCRRAGEAV
jgi:predicted RNA polymerase sigma factor